MRRVLGIFLYECVCYLQALNICISLVERRRVWENAAKDRDVSPEGQSSPDISEMPDPKDEQDLELRMVCTVAPRAGEFMKQLAGEQSGRIQVVNLIINLKHESPWSMRVLNDSHYSLQGVLRLFYATNWYMRGSPELEKYQVTLHISSLMAILRSHWCPLLVAPHLQPLWAWLLTWHPDLLWRLSILIKQRGASVLVLLVEDDQTCRDWWNWKDQKCWQISVRNLVTWQSWVPASVAEVRTDSAWRCYSLFVT